MKINKRIGITLYLNDYWQNNWGGELIIYSGGEHEYGDTCVTCEPQDIILPKANRLVIVDGVWHKVNVNLNREVNRLAIQTFIQLD